MMLNRRALESDAPNANIFDLLAVSPQRIDFGMLVTIPTIDPVTQSNTRISFFPAPPQNSKSYLPLLKHAEYKNGEIPFSGFVTF